MALGTRQFNTLADVIAAVSALPSESKTNYFAAVKNGVRKSGEQLRLECELPSRRLWEENATVKAIDDLIANLWLQSDEHKALDGDHLSSAVQAKWKPIKTGLMEMMAVFDARAVTREMEDVFVSVFWEFLEGHLSGADLQLAEFQAAIESTIAQHRAYVQESDSAQGVADQAASQSVKHGFNFLVTKLATATGFVLAGPAAVTAAGAAAIVTTAVAPAVKEFTLRSATAISGAAVGAAVHVGQMVTGQTDHEQLLTGVKTVLLDLSSAELVKRQKRQTKLKFTAQLKETVEKSICQPLDQKHDHDSSQQSAAVRQKLRAYTRRLAVPQDDAGLPACEEALEKALTAVPIGFFGQFLLLWGDTSATAQSKVAVIKAQLALAERAAKEIIEFEELLQSVSADGGNPFVSFCQKIFTIPERPAVPTDGSVIGPDSQVAFYRARIAEMPGNPLFHHAVALAWQQETGLSIAGVDSYAHWANALVRNDLLTRHQVDDMRRCWEMSPAQRQAYLCVRLATAAERTQHAELIQRTRGVLEDNPSLASVESAASDLHGEDALWRSSGARTPAMRLLWLEHLDLLDQLIAYSKSSQPPVDVTGLITEPSRKLETLLNAPAFDEAALGALQSALITMHGQYRQLPIDKRPLLKPASPLSQLSLLGDAADFVRVLSVAEDAQAELADQGAFDIHTLDLARTGGNPASHAEVVKQIQLLREILGNRNRVLMAQAEYHFFMSMAIAAQAQGGDAYEAGLGHLAAYVHSAVPAWYQPVKPFDTSSFFNDPKAVERLQGLIQPSIKQSGSLWTIQCQPYAGFSPTTVKALFAAVLCPDELLSDQINRGLSADEQALLTMPNTLWVLYRQVLAINARPDTVYTSESNLLSAEGALLDAGFLQEISQVAACQAALERAVLPGFVQSVMSQKIAEGFEKLQAQRDAFEGQVYDQLLTHVNGTSPVAACPAFHYFRSHRIAFPGVESSAIPMLQELPWLLDRFSKVASDVMFLLDNYRAGSLTASFWQKLKEEAKMDFAMVKAIFSRNVDVMVKRFGAQPGEWLKHALAVEQLFNTDATMETSQLVIIAKIGLLPMMDKSDESLWRKTPAGETAWVPRMAKREYFKKIYGALCRAFKSYQESYWKIHTTPGMAWNDYRKTAIDADIYALHDKLQVRFRSLVENKDAANVYQPITFEKFLEKYPNKGELEAFLKTLCARREGDRDQTDPKSAVALVEKELRALGVTWQAEKQHWLESGPAKVGFNNTVAQQWWDPDKQWMIPVVLRYAPDFNAGTGQPEPLATLDEDQRQKSRFTEGLVKGAFTAMGGDAVESAIEKGGLKRGEYLSLCQQFDQHLQAQLHLTAGRTLDAWVQESCQAYNRSRTEKERSALAASLSSMPIELVFEQQVSTLRVANAGLAAGIVHSGPQREGVKRLAKIRLRSDAVEQWLDSACQGSDRKTNAPTVRQVMAQICLSALEPSSIAEPVAAGAASGGEVLVPSVASAVEDSSLLRSKGVGSADQIAADSTLLTPAAVGPASPSGAPSSVSGRAFYFDLPYQDSNGDEVKADAQADAIITAARQRKRENAQGVMITYSANDEQSQLIWNSYQQGKSTATLSITGTGQAKVMAALIGKLQPGQRDADLADFIKIAAVTTMGAGQANTTLSNHANLVARDLTNITEYVRTNGYDLLLWQNQDTGSGNNANVAIGGGNTKVPADIDGQIQTGLKGIVSVDSHVVRVAPKAVASNGSHGDSEVNEGPSPQMVDEATRAEYVGGLPDPSLPGEPTATGTKNSTGAPEVPDAERKIFAAMLDEVQRIRWGALYQQLLPAAMTEGAASVASVDSDCERVLGVLSRLYYKMVYRELSTYIKKYVNSRDYHRALARFPQFIVKQQGSYQLLSEDEFLREYSDMVKLLTLVQSFCPLNSEATEETIAGLQAVLRTVGIEYTPATNPWVGTKKEAQAKCQLDAESAVALREELSRQAAVTVANVSLEEKLEFKQGFVDVEKAGQFTLPAMASGDDATNASLSTPAWVETVIVQAVGVQGCAQFTAKKSDEYQRVKAGLSQLNVDGMLSRVVLTDSDARVAQIREELKSASDAAARAGLKQRWLAQGLKVEIMRSEEERAVFSTNAMASTGGTRSVTTYSVEKVVDVAATVLQMPWSALASTAPAAGTGVDGSVAAEATIKDGLCWHAAVAIAPPKPVMNAAVSAAAVGVEESKQSETGKDPADQHPPAGNPTVTAAHLDVGNLKLALHKAVAGYNNHPIRGFGKSLLELRQIEQKIANDDDSNNVLSELIAAIVVSPSRHFDAPSARGRLLRQLSEKLNCALSGEHSYSLESTATQLSQLVCQRLQGDHPTPEAAKIDDKLRNFLTANFKRALEYPADFGQQGVAKMVQAMLQITPATFLGEFATAVQTRRTEGNRTLLKDVLSLDNPNITEIFLANRNNSCFLQKVVPKTATQFMREQVVVQPPESRAVFGQV